MLRHGFRRFCRVAGIPNFVSADHAKFISAENANYLRFSDSTRKLQAELHAEAVALLVPEGMSAPELNKGFYYFQRFHPVSGLPSFRRIPADTSGNVLDLEKESAIEETVLCMHAVAQNFSQNGFAQVAAAKIHIDNQLMGFVADERGDERWTLRFRDIVSSRFLECSLPYVRNFEWIDNPLVPGRFLVWTEMDPVTLRSVRVVRGELLETPDHSFALEKQAILWDISEDAGNHHYLDVVKSKDGKMIFLNSSSKVTSEIRAVAADDTRCSEARVVVPPTEGVEYFCEHRLGYMYIVSNFEFSNFGLYRKLWDAEVTRTSPLELVHHSTDMTISELDVFRRGIALYGTGLEGQPAVEILRFKEYADKDTYEEDLGVDAADSTVPSASVIVDRVQVPFKGNYAVGKLELAVNGDFEAEKCRFGFRSPRNPGTWLEFDFASRKLEATKSREFQHRAEVDMQVNRFFVPSEDGKVEIPLTVVSEPGGMSSPAPTVVFVYGAYGQVLEPDFSPAVTALVKRGWRVAFSHVRGGGERGPAWHTDGGREKKINSVADFKACCEFLFANKISTPPQLCAVGASAGGVVLGAALNMYGKSLVGGAAILRVPFVDVLSTLENPELPLSTHERDEWGNVTDPTQRAYIESMSPVDNIRSGTPGWYPPLMVTSAADDTRVPMEGVVKYVQKLRAEISDPDLIVARFSEAGEGGHFGSACAASNYSDTCTELAFMMHAIDRGSS